MNLPKPPADMTDEELSRHSEDGPEYQDEIVKRMRSRDAASIVPKAFRGGFEALDEIDCKTWQAHRDRIVKWTEQFTVMVEKGLYLSGPLGCGKSRLAWCVVDNLMSRGYEVSAWNVSTMFDAMLNSFGNPYHEPSAGEIMDRAQRADLLLLDDLGAEPTDASGSAKNWVVSKLYTIGNHRLENEKPILVTSNMTGGELSKHMPDANGRRFIDRLCGMIEKPGLNFAANYEHCVGCKFFEEVKEPGKAVKLKCNMKSLRRG